MTRTAPPPETTQTPSPWTRPGFLGSAAVLGLIVLLGVGLVLFGGQDAPTPAPERPAADAPPAAEPTGRVTGCDLEPGPQVTPNAPPVTEWELVGTVAAPVSERRGPTLVGEAGVRTCYSRDPLGALYAAAGFLAAATDPEQLEPAIATLAAPGPGRDVLVALARTDPTAITGTGARYQIAGFSFLAFTGDEAEVAIVVTADGGYASVPLTLLWTGDDWKVDLPPSGDLTARAQPIPSLTGYVPWAGA